MSQIPNGWNQNPNDSAPSSIQTPPEYPLNPQGRSYVIPLILCGFFGAVLIIGGGGFLGYKLAVRGQESSEINAEISTDDSQESSSEMQPADTTHAPNQGLTELSNPIETTGASLSESTISSTTTTTTTTQTTPPTAVSTTAAPRASISNARIVGVTHTMGDGYMYRLDVTGNYAYWIASVAYESAGDNTSHMTVSSRDLTADNPYLTGGSAIWSISASVTPYDSAGNAGETVNTKWNKDRDVEVIVSVESCNMYGNINTHGQAHVDGFSSSYIINSGSLRRERDDLENGWNVVAKRICWNYSKTWYEVWDADDGDYYGWVDWNILDFYP